MNKNIIGVLGPRGSFSEKAGKKWLRKKGVRKGKYELKYFADIPSVISAMAKGEIDFAVIPVENSLEGPVTVTLDLLMDQEGIKIVDELVLKIVHCLLAKKGCTSIKKIASHPQGLAQCRKYIEKNYPGVELMPMDSTSAAALKASKSKNFAAIASKEAAAEYGLEAIEEGIQDNNANCTRFIVIGNILPAPTGNDKTSLIVWPKRNKAGALYEILGVFAKKNIDLTKVESRTTKRALGDYRFHMDLKGHMNDKNVAKALAELKKIVKKVKILGSYPLAGTIGRCR